MQPEQTEQVTQAAQLEHILGHMAVGAAILDCATMRFLYANAYLVSLGSEPWRSQGIIGRHLSEVMPAETYTRAAPVLQRVCTESQGICLSDIPYEGFLETRGRTYWRISIEPSPNFSFPASDPSQGIRSDLSGPSIETKALLITIEDVTNHVRGRMHLEAIHHISAAIARQSALPGVLDRILQAVQDLAGSQRCAVILIDYGTPREDLDTGELAEKGYQGMRDPQSSAPTIMVAAQKGLYAGIEDWHPQVSERLLVGKVMRARRSLIVPDTSLMPEVELPLLDDKGRPRRPGSAICVPIFETRVESRAEEIQDDEASSAQGDTILGAIEVYHRRSRGLPLEEIELLEQFAQQAGLALRNASLFQHINHLARVARQQVHQRENVMQAIPDGVIIYDANWRVLEVNHAARRLLGWTDEVLGLHIREALTHSRASFAGNSPTVIELVASMELDSEKMDVDEFKMIGADGQRYTVRRSKAPIKDDAGKTFAYVVVYHDVTEQAAARERIEAEVVARTTELAQRNEALQSAQAALGLQSERLELLISRLSVGVMLISASDRRVMVINSQAAQMLLRMGVPLASSGDPEIAARRAEGLDTEEVLRNTLVYGPSGARIPYDEQPLFLALHKGEASEMELCITQPDEQPLFLLVNAAPLFAGNGAVTNVVCVWQDITRMKALERAREDFFTTMAHELKTPLANIRAHLSALQANDMVWSTEAQLDFLRTADEQVERLVGMINHFLDASRVEAGALRLELEPILLPEMFEDLQDRLEALITASGRRLAVTAPPHLPAVMADYELIMSVLTNLLSNAFRYAPEGDTVYLEAEAVSERPARQDSYTRNSHATGVEIRVVDRGPGITPERQAELFTRFSTFAAMRRPGRDRPGQPVEVPTERRRGSARWSPATGLGLYISRGIIEAHGSELRLQSNPGQGATFAFTLSSAGSHKKEVE